MALILVEPFVSGVTTDISTAGSNDYSRFTAIPFLVGERCGYHIEIKTLFHVASPNID
ncbi:hypothetical protein MACH01_36100 [Thalassospira tepidiphila]|nr:hypothetical protein MACH01_36100 [Thalassospira tepidiphila]